MIAHIYTDLFSHTLQSRVRRREEAAAASISTAAGVLADSFSDWIRESLLSDSDESHRGCSCAPATLVGNKLNAECLRISSSSSEYFVPRTVSLTFPSSLVNRSLPSLSRLFLKAVIWMHNVGPFLVKLMPYLHFS